MNWWMWAALGLVLAAAEILTPGGFFVIFFGLAALVVALLAFVGLAEALSFQILPLLGLLGGVAAAVPQPVAPLDGAPHPKTVDVDSFVGDLAVASSAIRRAASARRSCAAASWNARNDGRSRRIDGRRPLPRDAGRRPRNLD